jgi:hypothetical protein
MARLHRGRREYAGLTPVGGGEVRDRLHHGVPAIRAGQHVRDESGQRHDGSMANASKD